jgi:hypothetical protein
MRKQFVGNVFHTIRERERESTFTDMHRAARLQLLSSLSRYGRMNESLHVAGGAAHSTTEFFDMRAPPVTPR